MVRGGVEPPTFRFSGVLSRPELTSSIRTQALLIDIWPGQDCGIHFSGHTEQCRGMPFSPWGSCGDLRQSTDLWGFCGASYWRKLSSIRSVRPGAVALQRCRRRRRTWPGRLFVSVSAASMAASASACRFACRHAALNWIRRVASVNAASTAVRHSPAACRILQRHLIDVIYRAMTTRPGHLAAPDHPARLRHLT